MQERYLQHHGIQGQKWGVRRYQNADGTLTTEGKLRYSQAAKKVYKKAEKILDIPKNKLARYDAVSYVATDLNAFKKHYPGRKMTLTDLEDNLYFSATGGVGYDETINAFSIYANENGHANELKKMYDKLNSIPGAKTKNGEWIENQGEIKLKYALQMSGVENKDSEKPTIGFDDTTKASISEAKKIVNNITDIENPQTSLIFWEAVEKTGISGDKNLDDMTQADWDKINEEIKEINLTKNYIAHSDSYLQHHGIQGQKWGVRRYQNADGSLTEAGRKRYGYSNKEIDKYIDKDLRTTKLKDGNAGIGVYAVKRRPIKNMFKPDTETGVWGFNDTKYSNKLRYKADKFANSAIPKNERNPETKEGQNKLLQKRGENYVRFLLSQGNKYYDYDAQKFMDNKLRTKTLKNERKGLDVKYYAEPDKEYTNVRVKGFNDSGIPRKTRFKANNEAKKIKRNNFSSREEHAQAMGEAYVSYIFQEMKKNGVDPGKVFK